MTFPSFLWIDANPICYKIDENPTSHDLSVLMFFLSPTSFKIDAHQNGHLDISDTFAILSVKSAI